MTAKTVAETFLDYFSPIKDPRIDRSKLFPLEEVLFLVLTAVLCGSESWRGIETFGRLKIDTLRLFFPYVNGIPSDDTIRLILRRLSPKAFQSSFTGWIKSMDLPSTLVLSIDGKTSRGTRKANNSVLHMVSAFASESNLILGQQKTTEKSNEITAIPQLLRILDFSDKQAIITIDAAGCQREIVQIIVKEKQADYCIALKANQPSLLNMAEVILSDSQNIESTFTTKEVSHGRTEIRECSIAEVPDDASIKNDWSGLVNVIKIISRRTKGQETSTEIRYYITSLFLDAETALTIIRSHWSIENGLHWIMDTAFRDDESKIRSGNAPSNMVTIKHFAVNLLKMAKRPGDSIKRLRQGAGWSQPELLRILSGLCLI
jgi:predicted transposase YbfD/YdcC